MMPGVSGDDVMNQANLDRLIVALADAVDALADAVENGQLKDKQGAAMLVVVLATKIVYETKT